MQEVESHKCFDGLLSVVEHESEALKCKMRFSVFLPSQAKQEKVPFITFLSGLTCTHENFTTKAGAYKYASQHGLAVIAPDTSPRGANVPDDPDSYDFGQGAGFYINATIAPWAENFQMETYIADELQNLVCNEFSIDQGRQGIVGHSMGGHGALTLGLKYSDMYKSLSAFSPIVAPSQVPWGQKAFLGYLGNNHDEWKNHDASSLMANSQGRDDKPTILIDQGRDDQFLGEQLKPELFEEACDHVGQELLLRKHAGYDHSYFFIQSYIEDHIQHHAQILLKTS